MSAIMSYRGPIASTEDLPNENYDIRLLLLGKGLPQARFLVFWSWKLGSRAGKERNCKTGIIAYEYSSTKGGGGAFVTTRKALTPRSWGPKIQWKRAGMHCLTGTLGLRLRPPK